MFFDDTTLRKLHRLTLVAAQVRAGRLKGDRRSTKRGSSLEFADFRVYTPGDDLRRLDWNAYARLDRPFLKLFEEQEDLAVHILLDASQSMDWRDGERDVKENSERDGERNKFCYGLKLAAALGAIALASGDLLHISSLQAGRTAAQFGPTRGQLSLPRMLQFLERQSTGGKTDLNRSLYEYTLANRRPGLAFLISDLFSDSGDPSGAVHLLSRGYQVNLVHLLSPDELDPPLAGDLRLVDVETGQSQEVSLDEELRDLYRHRLQAWREEIQRNCRKRGMRYLGLSTAQPWEQVVLQEMRKAGVIK